jgi:hypothetical protein
LTCEYLREFSKKIEMILMLFSGAWGKVIHEKNLKQKISWHCPFNRLIDFRPFQTEDGQWCAAPILFRQDWPKSHGWSRASFSV